MVITTAGSPGATGAAAACGRWNWTLTTPGHKSLAVGREVLVLGAQRSGQLPLLGADTHRQARSAQDRDGQQAQHVITGPRTSSSCAIWTATGCGSVLHRAEQPDRKHAGGTCALNGTSAAHAQTASPLPTTCGR